MTASTTASLYDRPATSPIVRLSIMMFLQYAVWGVWLPFLAAYLTNPGQGGLGFTDGQMGTILGLAGSIGALSAPFAGQLADRYLNAERALAGLLLLGGVLQLGLAQIHGFYPFLLASIAYSVLYMPTLSLTNSISFSNLHNPEKEFPFVRVWGTIGWVVMQMGFPLLWLRSPDAAENTGRIVDALRVSGAISIFYALYCVAALPKTPPKPSKEHPFAFLRAFGLLAHPGFFVVTLIAVPISMIHYSYFYRNPNFLKDAVQIPQQWMGTVMSVGQFSEIVFLALLGFFLKRLGYKWVLALGGLAYTVRFAIFAQIQPWYLIAAAQALHGLCYGCFFAGAFIYVERIAPADVRHSAQTVFGMIILGVGPVLAGYYSSLFKIDAYKPDMTPDAFATLRHGYSTFWLTQSAVALGATVLLVLLFRPGVKTVSRTDIVEEQETEVVVP